MEGGGEEDIERDKAMFFKPMEKILHQRYEATEGARKLAEESLKRAAEKTAQYEAALRSARTEVYGAQEKVNKKLQEIATARLIGGEKAGRSHRAAGQAGDCEGGRHGPGNRCNGRARRSRIRLPPRFSAGAPHESSGGVDSDGGGWRR